MTSVLPKTIEHPGSFLRPLDTNLAADLAQFINDEYRTDTLPLGSCHLSWRVLSLSVARIVNYSVNLQPRYSDAGTLPKPNLAISGSRICPLVGQNCSMTAADSRAT